MSISMTADFEQDTPTTPQQKQQTHAYHHPMPVSVQVLSTLLFAAFAIPVTIVALNIFWPAGIALAIILGWRGGFAPYSNSTPLFTNVENTLQTVIPSATQKPRSSGNASFDAYRSDMLTRLETEQENFENFLGRLRDAKDQSEFDQFMDDRAARTRANAED